MKILIADDHAVVRQGYGALLKAMMSDVEVIEAANGTDAALLYIQEEPDVTVLDIKMPDLSGIEVCRRIRQRDPTAKILMFSMYEDASVIKEAMAAGALGYLSKSSPPDTMLAAVSRVSRSERYLDERLENLGFGSSDNAVERASSVTLADLPPRERDIAARLLEGKSNLVIAEELGISAKTVANRATVIRQKFGVENTAGLIRKVLGSN